MEVRGIGIINVADMFGVKSIRTHKRVDLVVTLKPWNEVTNVERVGLEQEKIPLGIEVLHVTIPVAPGRDLARLVEVAAFPVKSGSRPQSRQGSRDSIVGRHGGVPARAAWAPRGSGS